jgi:hypothetical protein
MGEGSSPIDMVGEIPRMLGVEPSHIPGAGFLFTDPAQKEHEKQMRRAAQAMQTYQEQLRPVTMQGLRQSAEMYRPGLQMMEYMYGPEVANFDIEKILQDPYEAFYATEEGKKVKEQMEKEKENISSSKSKKKSGTGAWSPLSIFGL